MSVILSRSQPKARKVHVCDWCQEDIEVGRVYRRWVGIWYDPPPMTMKMHIDCYDAAHRGLSVWGDEPLCNEKHVRGADCDH